MYIQGTLDGAQTLGALGRMSWTLERYKCHVCVLGTLEVNTLGHHSSGCVRGRLRAGIGYGRQILDSQTPGSFL